MTPPDSEVEEALRCVESGDCQGLEFADCGKVLAAALRSCREKLAEANRLLEATGASCQLKGCDLLKSRLESAERVIKAVRFYVGPTRNSTIWAEAFAGMEDALAAHTKTQGERK